MSILEDNLLTDDMKYGFRKLESELIMIMCCCLCLHIHPLKFVSLKQFRTRDRDCSTMCACVGISIVKWLAYVYTWAFPCCMSKIPENLTYMSALVSCAHYLVLMLVMSWLSNTYECIYRLNCSWYGCRKISLHEILYILELN